MVTQITLKVMVTTSDPGGSQVWDSLLKHFNRRQGQSASADFKESLVWSKQQS
jgi:hypothetical protein